MKKPRVDHGCSLTLIPCHGTSGIVAHAGGEPAAMDLMLDGAELLEVPGASVFISSFFNLACFAVYHAGINFSLSLAVQNQSSSSRKSKRGVFGVVVLSVDRRESKKTM